MRCVNIGGWQTEGKEIKEGNIALTLDELCSEGGVPLLFIEIPLLGKSYVRCNLDALEWAIESLKLAYQEISEAK